MFDNFWIIYNPAEYFGQSTNSSNTTSAASTSPSSSGRVTAHDPIREYKRGINHDPSLFTDLKDFKQRDPWYIGTKSQACAQDVDDILDPKYKANTVEEKAILD